VFSCGSRAVSSAYRSPLARWSDGGRRLVIGSPFAFPESNVLLEQPGRTERRGAAALRSTSTYAPAPAPRLVFARATGAGVPCHVAVACPCCAACFAGGSLPLIPFCPPSPNSHPPRTPVLPRTPPRSPQHASPSDEPQLAVLLCLLPACRRLSPLLRLASCQGVAAPPTATTASVSAIHHPASPFFSSCSGGPLGAACCSTLPSPPSPPPEAGRLGDSRAALARRPLQQLSLRAPGWRRNESRCLRPALCSKRANGRPCPVGGCRTAKPSLWQTLFWG